MKDFQLTDKDVELLNSKIGLKQLFMQEHFNIEEVLNLTKYEIELRELQAELVKLQDWTINNKKKVVILFEGRDAAGKGGAIRRIAAHINPRYYRIVALPKPTEDEAGQWYFQRYVEKLPKPGEIVFFDRSWYNRAVVEPVNGFCTQEEYDRFMEQVNDFEKMIIDSGIHLIKFYFSISKEEQAKRFKEIKKSPLKKWKMTPVDEKAQELWDEYSKFKAVMLKQTHTSNSPWIKIEANEKTTARIETIKYILDKIPYKK